MRINLSASSLFEKLSGYLIQTGKRLLPGSFIVIIFIFLALAFISVNGYAFPAPEGPRPPRWLIELSRVQLPELSPRTEAVYLLYEQKLSYSDHGYLLRSGRQALMILRSEGIEPSKFLVRANTFNTRVRKMNAWVINPDGSRKGIDIKSAVSTSLAPDTLYWDVKALFLVLPQVTKNSLVGYEWEEEIIPISLEDVFPFQQRLPVLKARYLVNFPSRCQPLLDWVNWPVSSVVALAQSLSVEMDDIPAIKDEPLKPSDEAVAGRLLIRLKPDVRPKYGHFFADWKDLGLWYDQLCGERRQPDESVKLKASELVSGLSELRNKIERLASFVQQEIRYVSIQIGIGGYQPHPARQILSNRYGDCKDKATLLAALLSSLGVDSYYLILNTERLVVTESTPVSLFRFNHVILAIKLPDDCLWAGAEAVVSIPELGRLLIFDPTMTHTPPGRLPFYLQKNYGLLVAGQNSRLLKFPGTAPEEHQLIRQGRFSLSANGTLKGRVIETISGFQAEAARMKLRDASERDRHRDMEKFLAPSLGSFYLEDYEYLNLDSPDKNVEVRYAFRASSYLNKTGDILTFKPGVLVIVENYDVFMQKGERRYPLLLSSVVSGGDIFEIELPDGYTIEKLPEPVALKSDFADYLCHMEMKDNTLVLERRLQIKEDYLPPERFAEALKFFHLLSAEERRRLLLKKTSQEN